jgi:hypothetical protein
MDKDAPIIPIIEVFDGTRRIDEIEMNDLRAVTLGKHNIQDIGRRLAQIRGLKPGGESIRTEAMIDEIIERLRNGETQLSICLDPHMPANSTVWNWREKDEILDARIRKAQAQGQHTLRDATIMIAMRGELSTNDVHRDALLIRTIEKNIQQRNRPEFGDKVEVEHKAVTINLPNRYDSDDI